MTTLLPGLAFCLVKAPSAVVLDCIVRWMCTHARYWHIDKKILYCCYGRHGYRSGEWCIALELAIALIGRPIRNLISRTVEPS